MINKTIEIWEGDHFEKSSKNPRPLLTTYILEGSKERGGVLICPGGGYEFTFPREAEPVALQFNAAGYHAFVLDYSVAPSKHPRPLLDLSRAVCMIRERAHNWNLNSEQIAVCGFSAGGHLAASLGVHWQKSYLNVEGIEIGNNYPDALILNYPVITFKKQFVHQGSFRNLLGTNPDRELLAEMSLENHVKKDTPPVFIWHTLEDNSVPVENSMMFTRALRKKGVSFELHVYAEGSHGLSLATEETATEGRKSYPHVATWIKLCLEWLEKIFK